MHTKDSYELLGWLKRKNLFAKKSLSQNFLIDFSVIKKIIDLSQASSNDTILEIGPGPGSLTKALLKLNSHVIAVEKDKRFAHELQSNFSGSSNLKVIESDILKVIDEVILSHKSIKVIANIPYNITSLILKKLCKHSLQIKLAVLMVQKEFGQKACAKKGKLTGVISHFIQFYYDPQISYVISNECFFPSPKVDSCILVLKKKKHPNINEKKFFEFVQFSFQNRRKKLICSLKRKYSIEILKSTFKSMELCENTRSEDLTSDDFLKLFESLKN